MADTSTYTIQFENASKAEADALAADLAAWLRDAAPQQQDLKIDRERTSATSQDFGATLVLVLGTTAITAIAKGLQAWLAGHTGSSLRMTKDGDVIGTNLDAESIGAIMKAAAARKSQ